MGFFFRKKQKKEAASISIGGNNNFLLGSRLSALENSAFWACVVNLCRTFGTLPLHVYKYSPNGFSQKDFNSDLALLLKNPCPYFTSYAWRFVMAFNFELHGVAMAIKTRTNSGKVVALLPVSPSLMAPMWINGELYYKYSGTGENLHHSDVFTVQNLPISATSVLCPVTYADKDIAVARSSQDLQDKFFRQGTSLGGILTVPKGTPQDVKDHIKNLIAAEYSGASNGYKTMIIEEIMKYEPIHITENSAAKMIEAQTWTVIEVARRFGVPPFFIGDLTKSTFANAEQQDQQLVKYAISPRAVAYESAYNSLCGNNQYVKYSLAGLLRGDHASRSAFYHNGLMDGWLSINEVRAFEDMNPIKDGNEHYFPANYIKIGDVGKNFSVEKQEEPAMGLISEKRKRDLNFLEETEKKTKSVRSGLEKIIRKELKAQISKLKELLKTENLISIGDKFKEFNKSLPAEYSEEYKKVLSDLMNSLIPLVKKTSGVDNDVDDKAVNAWLDKYSLSIAERHAGTTLAAFLKMLEKATNETLENDVNEMADDWIENVPADESDEEARRAGNAFHVQIFTLLNLQYMHVVAAFDSCDFCQKLDGKVASVNGAVLKKGDEIGDDSGNIRYINRNYKHPPWHRGCKCGVAPGK